MTWWKRFKPNQSTLPAALLATAIVGVALLYIWSPSPRVAPEMTRYGDALAQTLAHASAGHMLQAERIELAVLANHVMRYDEVAGVLFYNANNEIVAMSGSTDDDNHYTAPVTLDDTIAGYVSVVLDADSFAPPTRVWAWLLTVLTLIAAPFLSLGALQLSARGNRSLPIVSVPDPLKSAPQESFCLTVNLHNKIALARFDQAQALQDALSMAQEVCAIYPGFAVALKDRGIAILFDRDTVTATNAVYASFLLQQLLGEFETQGQFRCFLSAETSPGSPAEIAPPKMDELDVAFDDLLMAASLGLAHTVLMTQRVFEELRDEQAWARPFEHPLLDDFDEVGRVYSIADLPAEQGQLVDSQAMLILGFNAASA